MLVESYKIMLQPYDFSQSYFIFYFSNGYSIDILVNYANYIDYLYAHFIWSLASKEANTKKEIVLEKTIEANKAGQIIVIEKEEAEEILSQALPTLIQAREALNNLNKNDITEIRSFSTPPEAVQVVTECVAILLNYKEINWKVAKQMMSDPRFLNTLKSLDVDAITSKQQSQVRTKLKVD